MRAQTCRAQRTSSPKLLVHDFHDTAAARLDQAAQSLALLRAGAYNAMQLDINRPFARFVTYRGLGAPNPQAILLLNEMEKDPTLYLVPHTRDFFYLTTP